MHNFRPTFELFHAIYIPYTFLKAVWPALKLSCMLKAVHAIYEADNWHESPSQGSAKNTSTYAVVVCMYMYICQVLLTGPGQMQTIATIFFLSPGLRVF